MKRMKIGSAIVAILAAMTVLVTTGCGYGDVPPPPPPGMMEEIFNFAEHLETLSVGETDPEVIFEGIPMFPGGGVPVHLSMSVISHNGSNALRVDTINNWAGIDLVHRDLRSPAELEEFDFEIGDIIHIEGTNADAFTFFNVNHADHGPLHGWEGNMYAPGQSFSHTFEPLNAADINNLNSGNTAAGPDNALRTIRIRGNQANSSFIIANLTVQRDMAAPTVTIGGQTGNIVSGETGAATHRTATFPITARFLEGTPGTTNFADTGVVTGLPAGTVTPSGTITIDADGAGTGTLTLVVADDATLAVGEHEFTVTLLGTASTPGTLYISGLVMNPSLVAFGGEGYATVQVSAFRLATGGATSVPLLITGIGDLPLGLFVTSPSIVLDASGSGVATLAISGQFDDTHLGEEFELTVTAPGTRASADFTLMLGEFGTVFNMQTNLANVAAVEAHFAGRALDHWGRIRAATVVTGTPGSFVVTSTVGGPDSTATADDDGVHNASSGWNWSPMTILPPNLPLVPGDVLEVVIAVAPAADGAGQFGLGQIGGNWIEPRPTDPYNNVLASMTITHTLTASDISTGLEIQFNLWGGALSGTNIETYGFTISVAELTIGGYR